MGYQSSRAAMFEPNNKEVIYMNLGISLKVALAKSPMNNKMLAEMVPTSPQQVTNWIASGSINSKNLKRICELLNLKVSEFVALGE